jgi:hypothetical protein
MLMLTFLFLLGIIALLQLLHIHLLYKCFKHLRNQISALRGGIVEYEHQQ